MVEDSYYVINICPYCKKFMTDECKRKLVRKHNKKDRWETMKCKNFLGYDFELSYRKGKTSFRNFFYGNYNKNFKEV